MENDEHPEGAMPDERQSEDESAATPAAANAQRRPTVLVVDDDPALVQLLQFFLERKGFTVLTATDGPQALALATYAVPDLIVTDPMLASMDGRHLRQQLRTDPSTAHIPVVLLTAAADADPEGEFADVISKRLAPGDLIERIERHMR